MALEDLTPAVRVEAILNGDEITPANRLEYFLQKAATELPKPAAGDEGKVLAVNASGEWAAENPYDIVFRIDTDEGVPQTVTATVFNEQSLLDKMAVDAPISIYAFAKAENNSVWQYNTVAIQYEYAIENRFIVVHIKSIYVSHGTVYADNVEVVYDFEEHEWYLD